MNEIKHIENYITIYTLVDSIPKFYHYVSENSGDKPVLVIELLGKSLGHIWKYIGQFSTITVMRIGLQVVCISLEL